MDYTLLEVIIGLRDEYRNNEALLLKLKNLVYVKDKNIKDIDFNVICENGKKPDIGFEFIETSKNTKFKLNKKKTEGIVLRSNNSFLVETFKYKGFIKSFPDFSKGFNQVATSQFSNNISLDLDLNNVKLHITPKFIEYVCKNNKFVKYDSKEDIITCFAKSDKVSIDTVLSKLMYTTIPRSCFSLYHQNLIDNSESLNKVITSSILENAKSKKTKKANYSIVDADDIIVLKKENKLQK